MSDYDWDDIRKHYHKQSGLLLAQLEMLTNAAEAYLKEKDVIYHSEVKRTLDRRIKRSRYLLEQLGAPVLEERSE